MPDFKLIKPRGLTRLYNRCGIQLSQGKTRKRGRIIGPTEDRHKEHRQKQLRKPDYLSFIDLSDLVSRRRTAPSACSPATGGPPDLPSWPCRSKAVEKGQF
jgi:hypothetical protein